MNVCGIEMGDVAVIVGVDEEAVLLAMNAAVGDGEINAAPDGISADRFAFLSRMSPPTGVIGLRNLGDSMHPSKHAAMVAALRASGVPFVATCHNPYLLDHFTPSEVIVLHDGRADRLSDHPDAKTREAMTTGEFYAASGWETP